MQLGVERVKGQKYEVSITYNTQQMTSNVIVSGVTVYPALDAQDFRGLSGNFTFTPGSQVGETCSFIQNINFSQQIKPTHSLFKFQHGMADNLLSLL